MFALLTGLGLTAAAGLNAYIPFLIVGVLDRFTTVIDLPPGFAWIGSWWAIGIAALLLISEIVLDKIPAVDSINDMAGTIIRPLTGGVIGAGVQASSQLDHSQFMQDHSWLGFVGGLVIAGIMHSGKTAIRPVANVSTGGVAAPVLSVSEDISALFLSLAAVFVPILVVIILALMAWAGYVLVRRVRRFTQRRRNAEALP
ncbi:DUF4126 domain-containing protein [Branchiibius sp. NY16-3462-2]|uniref:DUF4126 domain-containing protein n=1 Tax=Branchiibius sp. NY16-3462-2 TaxID=1807500 RepID=UPI00079B38C9|nr:DUF4126 domain-containing protein [Branchiibius sp. NY16-3462-2]KYH45671.1 hypothetical protein AZH51_18340 [Branchiibius sp. NY16-3462-2]